MKGAGFQLARASTDDLCGLVAAAAERGLLSVGAQRLRSQHSAGGAVCGWSWGANGLLYANVLNISCCR